MQTLQMPATTIPQITAVGPPEGSAMEREVAIAVHLAYGQLQAQTSKRRTYELQIAYASPTRGEN